MRDVLLSGDGRDVAAARAYAAAAAAYEGALKAIHETGLEKLHAAEAVVVRALTHANEALARELDRRWHALLALLGAIEGCALVGCALYERRVHT